MHLRHIVIPLQRCYQEYMIVVDDNGNPVLNMPSIPVRTVDYASSVVDACIDDLREYKTCK